MAQIRGTHSSPGIYTRFTDVKYNSNKNNGLQHTLKSNNGNSGGGGNTPIPPSYVWVLGNKLPAVLS